MRIVVGIATAGRENLLCETLAEIAHQTRVPDQVYICSPNGFFLDEDCLSEFPSKINAIYGTIGASAQRNEILRRSTDADLIIFFDDDFFPEATYIANTEALFERHPDVVAATGNLLEDGIHGPGLSPQYARGKLAQFKMAPFEDCKMSSYYGVYGCNMAFRLAPVRANALQFDEALPLYSWQEDIDFSRQLAPYGKIVQSNALTGIHLGAKVGRTSGVRLGYSQVANPIYLVRKGTMSAKFGMRTMTRNLIANAARVFWAEPHIDRAGRCKGNILALMDFVRGRLHPQRVTELQHSTGAATDNRTEKADLVS